MASQTAIFSQFTASQHYTELCNALYEVELSFLARSQDPRYQQSAAALQRRLASIPHYVQSTAYALLASAEQPHNPLQLDIQSGCWLYKQKKHAPPAADEQGQAQLRAWLTKHAKLALPIPILVRDLTTQCDRVQLDTIDQLAFAKDKVHLNYNGWFSLAGASLESESSWLLKPTKDILAAACAGHRWGPSGKLAPLPLDLRSLLLSTTIHWQQPQLVQTLRK